MPVSNAMTVNPPILRHRNTEISVILRHFSEICTVLFEGFTKEYDLEIEISMILRQFLGKKGPDCISFSNVSHQTNMNTATLHAFATSSIFRQ